MPDPTHVKSHCHFVALIDMYLLAKNQLFISNKFKSAAIWLAKSIFGFKWRTRFFPDLWFKQNHKGTWFKIYISIDCFCKIQKTLFLRCIWALSPIWHFFHKNWALSVFPLKVPQLHAKFVQLCLLFYHQFLSFTVPLKLLHFSFFESKICLLDPFR